MRKINLFLPWIPNFAEILIWNSILETWMPLSEPPQSCRHRNAIFSREYGKRFGNHQSSQPKFFTFPSTSLRYAIYNQSTDTSGFTIHRDKPTFINQTHSLGTKSIVYNFFSCRSSFELARSRLDDLCPERLECQEWVSRRWWAGLQLWSLVAQSASLISVLCRSILSRTGDNNLVDTSSNRGRMSLLAISAASTAVLALLVIMDELASSGVAGRAGVAGVADATGANGSVSGTLLEAAGSVGLELPGVTEMTVTGAGLFWATRAVRSGTVWATKVRTAGAATSTSETCSGTALMASSAGGGTRSSDSGESSLMRISGTNCWTASTGTTNSSSSRSGCLGYLHTKSKSSSVRVTGPPQLAYGPPEPGWEAPAPRRSVAIGASHKNPIATS